MSAPYASWEIDFLCDPARSVDDLGEQLPGRTKHAIEMTSDRERRESMATAALRHLDGTLVDVPETSEKERWPQLALDMAIAKVPAEIILPMLPERAPEPARRHKCRAQDGDPDCPGCDELAEIDVETTRRFEAARKRGYEPPPPRRGIW